MKKYYPQSPQDEISQIRGELEAHIAKLYEVNISNTDINWNWCCYP